MVLSIVRRVRWIAVGGAAALSSLPAAGGLPGAVPAPATRPAAVRPLDDLFDPSRHMRVSEVRPGMKGYGLTVFSGTKIERFDVEVVSVLKNFNPKTDVVLIKFSGHGLENATAVAGMSGSPIFLQDGAGKYRMIGAFAYGWTMQKDPIAGVQPIEYMLKLPAAGEPVGPAAPTQGKMAGGAAGAGGAKWSLADCVALPGMEHAPATYPLSGWGKSDANPAFCTGVGGGGGMIPLATPLTVSGLSPRTLRELTPMLNACGLMPVQAGGGSGTGEGKTKIEPGSVLGVPLVGGDVDMSAVGTCTEVIGNHVMAFGHSFNSEGRVSLPIAGGQIQGIIANYSSSFKIGSLSATAGTLTDDQTVGIAGVLGAAPPVADINLQVKYTDGTEDVSYHLTTAIHPKLTPALVTMAVQSALTGAKELPEFNTVDYDLSLEFENGKTVHVRNTTGQLSTQDLLAEVGGPLIAAAENPFKAVMVKRVTGTLTVTPRLSAAKVMHATLPKSRYRPGDTVTAYLTLQPFRRAQTTVPVSIPLPKDLPDGTYQLTLSDWQKYMQDEQAAEPFKFTAETIDQVFAVIQDTADVRHDALYVRLLRTPDGVAIGHTAMPKLPSSKRQILIGSGRSDTTLFVSSSIKIVPMDRVLTGAAELDITIDRNADSDAKPSTQMPHRDVVPQP
jgi:hypothetical protein